uniref:ProAM N-terminal 20 peptide n=1 Tax=Oncorhynchus kisutch TaxID=8019 RepID=A0A8C7JG25_ONCKI
MVFLKRHNTVFNCLSGHHSMEMAVLLLLTVPVTVASPLRSTYWTQPDTYQSGGHLQTLEVNRRLEVMSEVMQDLHLPELKVIPLVQMQDMDIFPYRVRLKLRSKRAPQRGCQLGTCQLHNLANTLYQMGKTNGKDESKKAHDAHGYGR